MVASERCAPIRQYTHQCSIGNPVLDPILHEDGKSQPLLDSLQCHPCVIEDELAVDTHRQLATRFFEFPGVQTSARLHSHIDAIML